MNNAPIFIIGTERSGSNLLRVILNCHSNISIPHPPHVMKYFANLEGGYHRKYGERQSFEKMVRDILFLVKIHIYPWDIKLDPSKIEMKSSVAKVFDVFTAIYDQNLEQSGKKRWGCKSTFMIHHIEEVLERYPEAKFIYLVRDPRDVAVSSIKSVFNPFVPYYTGKLWSLQQKIGIEALEKYGNDRIMALRYEDLLTDPEFYLKEICDFLGESFEERLLDFHKTDDAIKSRKLSRSWENVNSPIISNNFGKFKKKLSDRDIASVEESCGAEMDYFGYDPIEGKDYKITLLVRVFFRIKEFFLHSWVEIKSLFGDRNHFRRWTRTFFILYLKFRLRR